MPFIKTKNKPIQPVTTICLSFLAVIVVGTLLLTLPISSTSGEFTHPIKALFTAASATCVTGLVVFDTGTYWNYFGQIVILIMVQIGGLGLVTFTSFFSFLIRKKLELRSIQVASESVNSSGFSDVKSVVKSVMNISFICEFIGAILLMFAFVPKYGLKGIYISFYISITSFCNAGFDVMGMVEEPFSSLTTMNTNPIIMIVVPFLIIAGGLGFVVWHDLLVYRKKKRFAFQTKVVVISTLILLFLGTVLTLVLEWNNEATLGDQSFLYKLSNSFFNSVTMRTAGFNTMDTTAILPYTKVLGIVFMFIGVAPGSTGGGIKITTTVILIMTIMGVIKGKSDTIIIGRKIEKDMVYKSLAIGFLFAFVVAFATIVLDITHSSVDILDAAFEVTSAISTTGLSTGPTGSWSIGGLSLLSVIMFIGRVGPISFALSLSLRKTRQNKQEVYPEGKIMVG